MERVGIIDDCVHTHMCVPVSPVLSLTSDQVSYLGDGDCNHDSDCKGSLICGNNNCNKEVIFVKFLFEHFLTVSY